jgi:hypothetical protein
MASLRQRQKDILRWKARKLSDQVVQRHGNRCYWCHRPLIFLKDLDSSNICSQTGRVIERVVDGRVALKWKGTLDHLQEISEENHDDLNNLVPSCSGCNGDRGELCHDDKKHGRISDWEVYRIRKCIMIYRDCKGLFHRMDPADVKYLKDNLPDQNGVVIPHKGWI